MHRFKPSLDYPELCVRCDQHQLNARHISLRNAMERLLPGPEWNYITDTGSWSLPHWPRHLRWLVPFWWYPVSPTTRYWLWFHTHGAQWSWEVAQDYIAMESAPKCEPGDSK